MTTDRVWYGSNVFSGMRMRFFGRCTPPLFRKAANTNYGQLGDRAGSFQQRLNEYSCADGISYVPNIQPLNIFVLDREFVNLRIYASIPSKDFLSIGIGSAQSTGGEVPGPPAANLFLLRMAAGFLRLSHVWRKGVAPHTRSS